MKQSASFAAAPSRAASALFASLGKDVVIREQVTLERRLAPLPTASLSWPRPQLEALRGVGLPRIGDLFARAGNAFARRFGAAARPQPDLLPGTRHRGGA